MLTMLTPPRDRQGRILCLNTVRGPDPVDRRDYRAKAPMVGRVASVFRRSPPFLPADVALVHTPIEDQGAVASCTGQAVTTAVEIRRRYELAGNGARELLDYSALFNYWGARQLSDAADGIKFTGQDDSGAYLRDAVKAAARWGVPPESLWAYEPDPAERLKIRPPGVAYDAARETRVATYRRVNRSSVYGIQYELANRRPCVGSWRLYSSNIQGAGAPNEANGYTLQPPESKHEAPYLHAMAITGYNTHRQAFRVVNSWSVRWGNQGVCWIPYSYVRAGNLRDVWSIAGLRLSA